VNLLLISRCPPYPLHLGDRLIVYHLAEQLAARGYTIDLLAFYDRDGDQESVAPYRSFFRHIQLIREPRRSTLAYLARLLCGMFPQHAGAAWSPDMWQAIQSRLAAEHYDVIQVFGGVQVYEYQALIRHIPNLIVPYESYSLFLDRAMTQAPAARQIMLRAQRVMASRFEKAMFANYGRVVVVTEVDAAALRALNPALPLRVIPNGIDLEYFNPAGLAVSPHPTLLFTGNYEYAPNVDAALFLAREIFPRVKQRLPEARLWLVGNAPPPEMRALAGEAIEVTGRVADVRPYLEQATLFICPLRFGAGIKNKVLEAMAMRKPIVATKLSADGIGLIEGEHVLYGDSAEKLGAAALRLLQDGALRQRMAQANRQLIEARFTWSRVADQYEALYRELMP
jgi:polysaccharide biosynthesis protein PslH